MSIKDNTLSLTDHNMDFGTNRKTSMLYCSPDHLQQNIEHRKLSIETLSQAKRLWRSLTAGYILYGMIFKKKIKTSQKEVGQVGQAGVCGVLFTAIAAFYRDTRPLSPVGMDRQCLMSGPLLQKEVGQEVGQKVRYKWDSGVLLTTIYHLLS